MISGNAAISTPGSSGLWWPRLISAGSKALELVARSRTTGLSQAASTALPTSPKPSPASRALRSARISHHMPKPNMMADAMRPSPGAANGVVPKKGIGIAFWTAGVPGIADIVKVIVPRATAPGVSRFGNVGRPEQPLRHRHDHEQRDEETDAAVGDNRAGQHDRQNRPLGTQLFGHEAGDRIDRTAVVHQLAEDGPEQEQRKELGHETGRRRHESLGPVRQQRIAAANSAATMAASGARTRTLQLRNDSPTRTARPRMIPSSPIDYDSSIKRSMSSVDRTPTSLPWVSRKTSAARRPSSRNMQKNAHSASNLDE